MGESLSTSIAAGPDSAKAKNSYHSPQRIDQAHVGQPDAEELLLLSTARHCLETVRSGKSAARTMTALETAELFNELTRGIPKRGCESKSVPPASKTRPADGFVKQNLSRAVEKKSVQSATPPSAGPVRVQLKLSKSLVRILSAFHKAGQRPSNVIEKTMWRDSRIQDAAAILGVKLPAQTPEPKAHR